MHRRVILLMIVLAAGAMAGTALGATSAADPGMAADSDGMEDMQGMEGMKDMEGTGQGGSPAAPPSGELRDPHAYADGYDFGPIPPPRMGDEHRFGSLLVDRLEWVHAAGNGSAAYDLQGWYGRDFDRAVVKAEGGIDRNTVREGRAELLWAHAVAPFWDTQLGLRNDHGAGMSPRNWLALGVQGLAPYWFELNITAYVGEGGRSALRMDGEYPLLLTQRLILQPRLEMNFYDRADSRRALGAGLADTAAGLRLRYEIRREFAPYVGVEWAAKYGGTAAFARAAGEASHETRLVAGVRFWF